MTNFHTVLKEMRRERGLTQQALADALGISKSSVNMYEHGSREPNFVMLSAFADFFQVDADYLLGKSPVPRRGAPAHAGEAENDDLNALFLNNSILPLPAQKKVPILGTIACGQPILAEENIEGFATSPADVSCDFCLQCRGDSMIEARIYDGDLVYIRRQDDVDNGEIAAVLIGEEATLKRVYKSEGHVILQAANKAFAPLVFAGPELEQIRIIGKAVAFISRIR